jgi:hypothetical protein
MEAAGSPQTLVLFYKTALRHVSEGSNLQNAELLLSYDENSGE